MLKSTLGSFRKISLIEKIIYLYILILPIDSGGKLLLFNRKMQYADLLFPALFIVWCLYKLKQKSKGIKGRIPAPYLIIALLLLVTLCSFINSINLMHSIAEWSGLLYLAVFFLIISDAIDSIEKFRRLLAVYSLSAVIAASTGLAAFWDYLITGRAAGNPFLFFWAAESSVLFFPRIKSFFYTPNMFVSFEHIGLVTAIGMLFLLNADTRKKAILSVCIGMMLIAVFLAGSQCLAGALLTLFIISLKFKSRIARILKYIIFISTLLVIIFAFFTTVWMIYPVKIDNDREGKAINININYAYSHHIIPSIYGISMFRDHPFLGVGIGTFQDRYPKYIQMDIEKISSVKMQVPPDRILDPHNTYTGALAEYGLLGFLAMLALFASFIKLLAGRVKERSDMLSYCLLAGLLGFLFNALFIDIMMMRHFWIFLAMILILHKNRKEANDGLKI